jgi:uncharacterized oligopeptide transporter (OPT) family protein
MSDTLQIVSQFKETLAGMHAMLTSMEPIIERQLEVIHTQRFIGNVGMFICFIAALVTIALSLKHVQQVKWSAITFKKRYLAIMIAIWLFFIGLFNVMPGLILMNMEKEVQSKTPDKSHDLLFGENKE